MFSEFPHFLTSPVYRNGSGILFSLLKTKKAKMQSIFAFYSGVGVAINGTSVKPTAGLR